MFFLTWIRKLYKVLSADASPGAIGFAAAFGLALGFQPWSGFAVLLLLSILVLRVQVTTALAFWAIGAIGRVALAPVFVGLGEAILETEALKGFWTTVLNLPVIAWLDLHVYAVLGGFVFALILAVPVGVVLTYAVIAYRKWAHEKLSENRFFRWLTNFWLTKLLRVIFVGVK